MNLEGSMICRYMKLSINVRPVIHDFLHLYKFPMDYDNILLKNGNFTQIML